MKLAYVDTCVWVTRIEGLRKYRAIIEEALDDLARDGWTFCVSDAVRLEALVNPRLRGRMTWSRSTSISSTLPGN
jgi:hypothetical protein